MRRWTLATFLILAIASVRSQAFMGLATMRLGHQVGAKVLTLLAGTLNIGAAMGTLTESRFFQPNGLCFDGSSNLIVVDYQNNIVRQISPSGTSTLLAGSHNSFFGGYAEGTGSAALFQLPWSCVYNSTLGKLVITDANNSVLRTLTAAGTTALFAGQPGTAGSTNATGSSASFSYPTGIAVDSSGNMYIADANNHLIRKVTSAGVVTTLAGTGSPGAVNASGTSASFNFPTGVVVDSTSTNLYVADQSNCLIRKIVISSGLVSTFAGVAGTCSAVNGAQGTATFNYPDGLGIDSANNLYIADTSNNLIRVVNTSGATSTLAGSGAAGSTDATGTAATFNAPNSVIADGSGNLYVADTNNSTIRKIVISTKVVTTYAGAAGPFSGVNGTGTAAQFQYPYGIAVDSTTGNVFLTDTTNFVIRKITPAGVVTTLAGSIGSSGYTNGSGGTARFNNPQGIVYDSVSGALYVADASNFRIRKVTTAGAVTLYAGNGTQGSVNNATLTSAEFGVIGAMTVDSGGNLYVIDTYYCTVRKVASTGVTTFAGVAGSCGLVNGTATSAQFNYPRGVAVDSSGNVYVADTNNSVIRKISGTTVTTFAGTANTPGFVDGTGTAAKFNYPTGMVADASGNIYVSDTGNNAIRKITPAGVVTTVIGNGIALNTAAELPAAINFPTDAALYNGNIYISVIGGVLYSTAP